MFIHFPHAQITLPRVIPTMTSIRFVTGKSSGILSDISSGILSGISSGISCVFWHSIWHSTWHIFWHIFWHSIWHSIWHIFWHSIWQTFWHFIWHIFWHSIWHIFWHSIWQILWRSIWQTFWHFIWHSIWHSIWHTFWHSIWQTFWHFVWHIFWHSFWHSICRSISHSIWRSIWHIFWHSIWPLRASGAHWARRVPGWGPAVLTELGGSQVEVQRCSLSSDGPRLRSSGAHWARKVPGWGPAVPSALRPLQLRSSGAHCVRKLAKSLAKSWQGGSEHGSGGRGGGGEGGGRGGGGGKGGEGGEENSDKIYGKNWNIIFISIYIHIPHLLGSTLSHLYKPFPNFRNRPFVVKRDFPRSQESLRGASTVPGAAGPAGYAYGWVVIGCHGWLWPSGRHQPVTVSPNSWHVPTSHVQVWMGKGKWFTNDLRRNLQEDVEQTACLQKEEYSLVSHLWQRRIPASMILFNCTHTLQIL